MPFNFVHRESSEKSLLFTFSTFSYLFLETIFFFWPVSSWASGQGTTAHSHADSAAPRGVWPSAATTCCVLLLSDQATLTFVQTSLIKLKKKKKLFIYVGCSLCVAFCMSGVPCGRASAEAGVGFAPGPPRRMWAPGASRGRRQRPSPGAQPGTTTPAPALQGLHLYLTKSQALGCWLASQSLPSLSPHPCPGPIQ